MPTRSRSSGVRVTTSDAIAVGEPSSDVPTLKRGRSGRLFGPVQMPGATGGIGSERTDFLEALAAQDMVIVDDVELEPTPDAVSHSRGHAAAPAKSESATIELDLAADEGAVILLEQDGLYSWQLPSQIEQAQPPTS